MGLRTSLLFSILAFPFLVAGPADSACPTAFELEVVLLVNAERANQGLAPFQVDDRLTAAAQGHSRDMAQNDFFSHTGSNGSQFNERIVDEGYSGGPLAENIAAGHSSPEAVVAGWMNSPGHRANILNASLGHIGVGHVVEAGSQYGHYWSQSFGGSATLESACGGGGTGSSAALERCQSDQLRALSKLCRSDLACHARTARRPDAPSAAEKQSACLERHRRGFEKSFGRATERAARALAVCPLSDSPASVASQLQTEGATLAASVTAGQTSADSNDGRLRGSLLKESARLCGAALAAEAKHARKPDAGRLGSRRTKARTRFDDRAARALAKPTSRSVSYDGASADAVGDAAETLADTRVQATSP